MLWIAIAAGGALGALSRHALTSFLSLWSVASPAAIFLVNAAGCAAIGMMAGLLAGGRLHLSETARAFVAVGVLGGFTTFSSFGLDTYTLMRGGRWELALANAIGQLVIGIGAVWAGFAVGAARQ